MDYFPHDTLALSDDKIQALRLLGGLEAVACYWAVLEKIYASEKPFEVPETNVGTNVGSSVEAMSVAYKLGMAFEDFRAHITTMEQVGLIYRIEGTNSYMSERAEVQIAELEKKRETARRNGKARSGKPKKNQPCKLKRTKVGTNVGSTSDTYKTENGIGIDKQYLYLTVGDGAAVAGATPPPPVEEGTLPVCPLCESSVKFDMATGKWHCDICGDVKEPKFKGAVA